MGLQSSTERPKARNPFAPPQEPLAAAGSRQRGARATRPWSRRTARAHRRVCSAVCRRRLVVAGAVQCVLCASVSKGYGMPLHAAAAAAVAATQWATRAEAAAPLRSRATLQVSPSPRFSLIATDTVCQTRKVSSTTRFLLAFGYVGSLFCTRVRDPYSCPRGSEVHRLTFHVYRTRRALLRRFVAGGKKRRGVPVEFGHSFAGRCNNN
ncbi:hypothetical protein MRX96_021410 [Rhipicephalus microplus]